MNEKVIWEESTFDLASTRDSTLVGTIGELIARKHLRKMTGALPRWFGAGQLFYPQYPPRTDSIREKWEISGLNGAQIKYLKNLPRQ